MTTDERLTALIEVLEGYLGDEIRAEEALPRLAALRAPGVGADDRCRRATQRLVEIAGADGPMSLEDAIEWAGGKVEALESALATARRERDEAVEQSRITMTTLAARDAEIAGLKVRAEKAEANYAFMVKRAADEKLDGYRELGARAAAAENAADTLRARVAELEARDREARGLLTRSEWSPNNSGTDLAKIGWTKIEDEYDDRRAAYLSGTVPPDPARGLIERAERWITAWVRMTKWPETHEALTADLRAHLGGG